MDERTMLDSISIGAAGSAQMANVIPRILKNDLNPGFFIKHFIKDMKLAREEAEAADVKLSTRGRYGIHAMYDLACNYNAGPQPIKAIAERQSIPEAYLEQLFAALKRDNLVNSVRGAQGGYTLSAAPGDISIGRILRALEGSLAPVSCLENDDACGKTCDCASRLVWRRLQTSIEQAMDAMTLSDMLNDYKGLHN